MNRINLNKLHRYSGLIVSLFLVLQTISGLLLDFGLFRNGRQMGKEGAQGAWDLLLVKIHYGAGLFGDAYHLLLGLGIIWLATSGWLLFLRIRRARRKAG
ncbi:hypothetical protein [Geobacter sp. SVR]|uniref:hypothetical protein n=1 Tax=Geobacter sp. SVR TaxID=2495594 RepID=UPI00143EF84F|nr:hypothetical protein [Geobacter sp. SVR]BCS53458.1 hypothetical protein GSVR_17660 [Geobacter sp. SVR]GCF85415.1 hypothetical protein GSbR_20150 [Geobacter sp. SVR]